MSPSRIFLFSGVAILLGIGLIGGATYALSFQNSTTGRNTVVANQGVNLPNPFEASNTASSTLSNGPAPSQTQTLPAPPTWARPGSSTIGGRLEWPWACPFYSTQTISINQSIDAMRSPPYGARIFVDNNTISFSGSQGNITILVLAMMPDKARNLTGMNPPSYATDDVFVIYGLIDPTLVIPSGTRANIVMVNLDDDMYHNYVVTSLAPPYYYMPMQGMMWSNSSSWYSGGMMEGNRGMMGSSSTSSIFAMMMPVLSPADYNQGMAHYYATSFTLNSYGGSYWYICTYPGHAQSGMYGKIVVVPS